MSNSAVTLPGIVENIISAHYRAWKEHSVIAAREAGAQLLMLRRQFPSGWGRFVRNTFPPTLSVERASKYMRIAEHWELIRGAVEAGPLTIDQALTRIARRRRRPNQPALFA